MSITSMPNLSDSPGLPYVKACDVRGFLLAESSSGKIRRCLQSLRLASHTKVSGSPAALKKRMSGVTCFVAL